MSEWHKLDYSSMMSFGSKKGEVYKIPRARDIDDMVNYIRKSNDIEYFDTFDEDGLNKLGYRVSDEESDAIKWCNFYLTVPSSHEEKPKFNYPNQDQDPKFIVTNMNARFQGYNVPIEMHEMFKDYYAYKEIKEVIDSIENSEDNLKYYRIVVVPDTKIFLSIIEYFGRHLPQSSINGDIGLETIRKTYMRLFNSIGITSILDVIVSEYSIVEIMKLSLPMILTVVSSMNVSYDTDTEQFSWNGKEYPVPQPAPPEVS